VNGDIVQPASLEIGDNFSSDNYTRHEVSCYIVARIGRPKETKYLAENAGWFIFCNGRAIAYANKDVLTGWGSLLPAFQPKHRPFLGLVFFVAEDPEKLPWTTTKSSVNEESLVWQETKRRMADIGRQVITFLDRRYGEGGTEITPAELEKTSGKEVSLFSAVSSSKKVFKVADKMAKPPEETSIQYKVKISAIDKIKKLLGRRSLSNSDIGRYTFDYFLAGL